MDIEYPGFGTIVVEGTRFDHDVVIEAGAVRARDKGPSRRLKGQFGHTPLSAAESIPWLGDKLIIGSGHSGRLPVLDGVREAAAAHGVELVEMGTADACDLIRRMNHSDVYAILHVTC